MRCYHSSLDDLVLGHPVLFWTQNMMTESNFLGTQPPLKMSLQFCIESKKRERGGCQLEVQQAGASFATFQTASKNDPGWVSVKHTQSQCLTVPVLFMCMLSIVFFVLFVFLHHIVCLYKSLSFPIISSVPDHLVSGSISRPDVHWGILQKRKFVSSTQTEANENANTSKAILEKKTCKC